jgi:thiopeptide-type bacteriocin biosynthesis protein
MNHDWLAVHIHYATYPEPLLVDGVGPLVERLRAADLIEGYFFIRYWQEGPHVRLRLRVRPGARDEVRQIVESDIGAFLRHRPSLYRLDSNVLQPVYRSLFLSEYSQRRWDELYGPDGPMPIHPTNTLLYAPYEPEYERYGGPDGVELAEWHFEHSSDVVLAQLAATNVHVHSVLLGQSIQLCLAMCYTMLDDDAQIVEFFETYRRFWQRSHGIGSAADDARYERSYARSADAVRDRVAFIRDTVRGGDPHRLTGVQRAWVAHLRELRERLTAAPGLVARYPMPVLLGSYLHMTNNRLGVTIPDEAYVSYVVASAVRQTAAATTGAGLR